MDALGGGWDEWMMERNGSPWSRRVNGVWSVVSSGVEGDPAEGNSRGLNSHGPRLPRWQDAFRRRLNEVYPVINVFVGGV